MIANKSDRIQIRKEFNELKKTPHFNRLIRYLYQGQRRKCHYCGTRIWLSVRGSYHIDHKTPIYRGGTNIDSNFILACPSCNILKSAEQLESKSERRKRIGSYVYRDKQLVVLKRVQQKQLNIIGQDMNEQLDAEMMDLIRRQP